MEVDEWAACVGELADQPSDSEWQAVVDDVLHDVSDNDDMHDCGDRAGSDSAVAQDPAANPAELALAVIGEEPLPARIDALARVSRTVDDARLDATFVKVSEYLVANKDV